MKKKLYLLSFLFFYLISCNNNKEEKAEPECAVNVVTNFLQASLQGDYQKAKTFMIRDSINEDRMKLIEYVPLSPEEKRGLATASINMHDIIDVNDSTTVVIYSNSFKNNWDTLRVLKTNGKWLVDFNYLFDHDKDTIKYKKDTLTQ